MRKTILQFPSHHLPFLLILGIGSLFLSCHRKKNDSTPASPYANAPSTYNFTDANYKKQSVVLLLADSLLNNLNTLNQPGATAFTYNQFISLYDNTNHLYSTMSPGVSLSSLVSSNGVFFSDAQSRNYFDSVAVRSANSNYLGTSQANTLASGLFLPEFNEKSIMGSLIYYQANLLFAQLPNADNSAIDTAYGTTDMIHVWDQLFGYMGMPVDYPTWSYAQFDAGTNLSSGTPSITQTDFLFGEYIGHSTFEYTVFTSQPTNYIQNIFNAFIVGRMAIANKDYTTRDAQAAIIESIWEKVIASQTISYTQNCIANIQNPPADPTILQRRWSEMCGFVHMFQYNPSNKLGSNNLNTIYGYVGNKPADATAANLTSMISLIKTTYGF
jgi:hypothetical protein